METAQVVYNGVMNAQEFKGTLFCGQKFWLSARVPQRSWLKEQVEANGGVIVKLEREADIKIVDHLTKEVIPETYSYKYIEQSIRKQRLENLNDHAIGSRAPIPRPVSSPSRPRKQTRTAYSEEDDRFLWKWVHKYGAQGKAIQGNEIFMSLEAENTRHPWQSWRDRWIKTLKYRTPPADLQRQENVEEEPAVALSTESSSRRRRAVASPSRNAARKPPAKEPVSHAIEQPSGQARSSTGLDGSPDSNQEDHYAKGDIDDLLKMAKDILNLSPRKTKVAWIDYAKEYPHREPEEWQEFFVRRVLPKYRANRVNANPFANPSLGSASPDHYEPEASVQNTANPSSLSPKLVTLSSERRNGDAAARSPFFHPETRIVDPRSTPGSQRQVTLTDHTTTPTHQGGKEQGARLTPSRRPKTLPNSPHKRMAISGEEGNDGDLSGSRRPHYPSKKPRQEEPRHESVQEILSTPDTIQGHASTQTPKTPTRSPHRSMLVDQEDDETEDEAEPTPIGVTVPSQTLSEPSWTPKHMRNANPDYESTSAQPLSEKTPSPTIAKEPFFETAPSEQFETAPTQFPESETQLRPAFSIRTDPIEIESRSLDTQAILTTSTQIPDFTIAEPDGGWSAYESAAGMARINAEPDLVTIDFSIAPPLGGWVDEAPPPSNGNPTVAPFRSETPSEASFLSDWLTSRITDGVTREQASAVLMSTSGDADLADVVLEYHRSRPQVALPPMEGVWTDEDDRDLQGGDGRGIKRVTEKHGDEGVKIRWEFWDMWREH